MGAANRSGEASSIIDFIARSSSSAACLQAFGEGLKRAGSTIEKADTGGRLSPIFTKAAMVAKDFQADNRVREEAIELLGFAPVREATAALGPCLDQGTPDDLQTAAVKTLAQHASADVTRMLIANWPNYGSKAGDAALTALTARDDRTLALLDAVQSGSIRATAFSALQVQGLVHHKDEKVVAAARKALAAVIPPSREEVVAKFKEAAGTKGDAKHGLTQYLARCMACHRAGSQGIQVGPDLVTVKTKGRDGILTAILEPSKEVAAQYIAYTVTTKDGQTLNGIIVHDDASSLTLRLMGGIEQTIQRSNIKTTSSTGSSLMPDGLETGMSLQDMADLLSFVEEVK
ncbi:MAG: putative rane-bound dehydrogenase domain protein [Verrucomicrobiaceae bacterium]|nr:putative rane-bound dehydrogenase domain protein [Verrucomicrobiaceae bacterium]